LVNRKIAILKNKAEHY